MKMDFQTILIPSGLFVVISSVTRSLPIGMAIAILSILLKELSSKISEKRNHHDLERHLPELIDHIITGIQSGMSLTDSMVSLTERGPLVFRRHFAEFEENIRLGKNFAQSITALQTSIRLSTADQILEALLLAKTLGGSDLIVLLRQLSEFTRSDLAFKDEIQAKQSWIRNSAHLSAVAPWLLLVILSLQPTTAQLYSSVAGISILAAGLFLTAIAYLWMGQLAKLPQQVRIFGEK